jgi:uncharacterized protein (TIGR02145 family)
MEIDLETVTIGDQIWMLKNLDVQTFNNGDSIPLIENDTDWKNQSPIIIGESKAASCYYNNVNDTTIPYGRLYNWHAIVDPRGLAPAGWRIATVQDWEALFSFLGDNFHESIIDPTHWNPKKTSWLDNLFGYKLPKKEFTNASGLSVLPGGMRSELGSFFNLKDRAYFWCASESILTGEPYHLEIDGFLKNYISSYHTGEGLSVRCVKI